MTSTGRHHLHYIFHAVFQLIPQTSTTPSPYVPPGNSAKLRQPTSYVPTVEYTSISTIRASTPLYVQNITQNVLFGLMVHGEGCYLWVYNAGVWDSMNWTCAMQGKTKPSLGNEKRSVLEVCDEDAYARTVISRLKPAINMRDFPLPIDTTFIPCNLFAAPLLFNQGCNLA